MLPAFGSHITLIWMPTGIAVASLVRFGSGCWPGVMLGAFAVNAVDGLEWLTVLAIAASNTTQAPAGVRAPPAAGRGFPRRSIAKRDSSSWPSQPRAGMLVSASSGVAMLAWSGALTGNWLAAWLTWVGATRWASLPPRRSCSPAPSRNGARSLPAARNILVWFCTTGLIAYAVFSSTRILRAPCTWTPSFPDPAAGRVGRIARRNDRHFPRHHHALRQRGHCHLHGTRPVLHGRHGDTGGGRSGSTWPACAVLGWLIAAGAPPGSRRPASSTCSSRPSVTSRSACSSVASITKITAANEGFTRLTGYTEEEMLGPASSATWVAPRPRDRSGGGGKARTALLGDGFFDDRNPQLIARTAPLSGMRSSFRRSQ